MVKINHMAQTSDDALPPRRPWYWLVVLAVGVALASGLVANNARARIDQNGRQFETAERLRLQKTSQSIDALFTDAERLTRLGSQIFSDTDGNLALTERLTYDMFVSRDDRRIYGLGPFYVRGGFGVPGAYVSVYDRRYDPRDPLSAIAHRITPSVVKVEYREARAPAGFAYSRMEWFRGALMLKGKPGIDGPYLSNGHEFLGIVQAFKHNGRFVGVMSAYVELNDFLELMRADLNAGDVAWIASHGTPIPLISTGPIPAANGHDLALGAPLPLTRRSNLWIAAGTAALDADNRRIAVTSIALVATMWCIAGLAAIGIVQRWRARERAREMERERSALQGQIALAKIVEGELRKAAFTDALTGLPNRAAFTAFVEELIAHRSDCSYAVFFVDLDRFNIVNETLGHLAGDDLLRTIGARLQASVESADIVARLGGDEFVVVTMLNSRSAAQAAELLLAHIGDAIVLHGRPVYPEASMGVVALDESYTTPEELLRDADIAMYEAKRRGRARFVIFDAQMRRRVAEESQLTEDLRRAIERGELNAHYQPIVDLATRHIVGFEALVRWQRSEGTLVEAGHFMHFAEQNGFAQAIDALMLRAVCTHAKAIFDIFPAAEIGINVSAAEFAISGLGETVEPLLRSHGIPPHRVTFEITETAMMTSHDVAMRAMERLREIGVRFVLDDFGTGYSSLAYLQHLPISGIKIDKSFVRPLPNDPKAVEIVRSIVMLARTFGLSTTAEGVESAEQANLLTRLGVDKAQGFFFSPAVDIATLVRFAETSPAELRDAAAEGGTP